MTSRSAKIIRQINLTYDIISWFPASVILTFFEIKVRIFFVVKLPTIMAGLPTDQLTDITNLRWSTNQDAKFHFNQSGDKFIFLNQSSDMMKNNIRLGNNNIGGGTYWTWKLTNLLWEMTWVKKNWFCRTKKLYF